MRPLLFLLLSLTLFGCAQEAIAPVPVVAASVRLDNDSLEARVDSIVAAARAQYAFPGAAVAVGQGDTLWLLKGYGTYTYDGDRRVTPQSLFDLASLTKVVATTTAVMKLYEQGRLDLDAPVVRYVPAFGQAGKTHVTVRDLMLHRSGLRPFRAFHREGFTTREQVLDAIFADSLVYPTGTDTRYSDWGMITLALAIEEITGEPFDVYVEREVFAPLGMTATGFRPAGSGSDPNVVPTEVDETFRKRLVQGEVHDETAYLLGGVAGHAGLFSNAEDLGRFARMLVNDGRVGDTVFLKPETIRYFTTRADTAGSTRAIGWDTRSTEGYSSAGTRFGPRAYGHTGFTGTSIWIDPDQRLFAILLTNRVYPTRENSRIGPVRAAFADAVYDSVIGR